MNAKPLARLYDRLTVWERIPLLIAAQARKDDPEYERLFNASPVRTWRVPEHFPVELAVNVMALVYVGEQLAAAGTYFFALHQMADADDAAAKDWRLAAEISAYLFAANLDAWRRFCSELGIAAETLTSANHHGWFLRYCEDHMPAHAPTAETLQARSEAAGRGFRSLVTADDLLADWRELLQAMAGSSRSAAERGNRECQQRH